MKDALRQEIQDVTSQEILAAADQANLLSAMMRRSAGALDKPAPSDPGQGSTGPSTPSAPPGEAGVATTPGPEPVPTETDRDKRAAESANPEGKGNGDQEKWPKPSAKGNARTSEAGWQRDHSQASTRRRGAQDRAWGSRDWPSPHPSHTLKVPRLGLLLCQVYIAPASGLCLRMSHEVMRNPWPVGLTTISLICNVQSLIHMDSHNDDQTCNLILPFSVYGGGELWVEHNAGNIKLTTDGPSGILHNTPEPVIFQPRKRHATMPWTGQRYSLIAYHVRQAERIPRHDVQYLTQLGFVPREDAFWADELPSP